MIVTNHKLPANLLDMNELARLMADFRDRLGLTKTKAASVLGVARNTIASLESGQDVTTGLPFKPRDTTLRALAGAMNEYAESKGSNFRVTFDQLKAAATVDQDDQPRTTPRAGIATVPDVPGSAQAGYIPWTDEEKDVLLQAYEVGAPLAKPFDPAFRRLPPGQRVAQFESFKVTIARYREFLHQQQGNGQE